MTHSPLSTARSIHRLAIILIAAAFLLLSTQPALALTGTSAGTTDIIGPAGSGTFGKTVKVLPNGNFVITDPSYSSGGNANLGAVYLYNGDTLSLISTLTGSQAEDRVGGRYGGVWVMPDGNFIVPSPDWDNGPASNAGAVTWCSMHMGCQGQVSPANSLVGSTAGDQVGGQSMSTLGTSGYLVFNPYWDNGLAVDAGAIAVCSASTGCSGPISAANSLVGSSSNDRVGYSMLPFSSSEYFVVATPGWDHGSTQDAGAVTFCGGTFDCHGPITPSNSLVGGSSGDRVGAYVSKLVDGDFVVQSPSWSGPGKMSTGAVTWCSGTDGCTGPVSSSNSLVGSLDGDVVGLGGVLALQNGSYVVFSPEWSNSGKPYAGAVTWCSGSGECIGPVSAANSLVGASILDKIGSSNRSVTWDTSHYLVISPQWHRGSMDDVGAVTLCSGMGSCTGEISATNSLVGTSEGDGAFLDAVGSHELGTYMVAFPSWDDGAVANVGAVTWCRIDIGCTGEIAEEHSLTGATANDQVGIQLVNASGGTYAVASPIWDGAAFNTGAVTVCSQPSGCPGKVSAANSLIGTAINDGVGSSIFLSNTSTQVLLFGTAGWHDNTGALTFCKWTEGCTGEISAANSLVGAQPGDKVGSYYSFLPNGDYVTNTQWWHNGSKAEAGATTWCSGQTGCQGIVSALNSLVGSQTGDRVSGGFILPLQNGSFLVGNPDWDNGGLIDAGALTFCSGAGGCQGMISPANSLVGSTAGDRMGTGMMPYNDGSYVVKNRTWDSPSVVDAGLVVWCSGTTGCLGSADIQTGVSGEVAGGGNQMEYSYDSLHKRLLVSRPAENRVTVLSLSGYNPYEVFVPLVNR